MTTPAPPPAVLAEPDARDAVLAALAAEHAAIWSYGLASAYLPAGVGADVTAAAAVHRARRDAVLALLEREGVAAPPAAAAYRTPAPVTDGPSAARLLTVAEEDVAAAWRSACERTPGTPAEVRGPGVDAVVESARVGVVWRRLAGATPTVPVFPGT